VCGVCSVGKKYNPLDFYPLDFPLFPLDGNPVDFFAGFAERALYKLEDSRYNTVTLLHNIGLHSRYVAEHTLLIVYTRLTVHHAGIRITPGA
jgi:hypothetical protein